MLFEDKRKRYKILLIIILPLIVLLATFSFLTFSSVSSLLGKNQAIKKDSFDIDEYDYHLRSNATDYQKELFKELKELIDNDADDLAIAECVAKNYVADTYTWDNKYGQWDVGGMYYVYSPHKNTIYTKIKDKFYGLLDKYQAEYGNTGLLEVTNIEITESHVGDELFEVDGNSYKRFTVNCEWDYSEDSRFANQVAHVQHFKVIKNNDGRFEIVVGYGNDY